jgi:hypothetical protein
MTKTPEPWSLDCGKHLAADIAADVLNVVNAQPSTPTKEELEARVMAQLGYWSVAPRAQDWGAEASVRTRHALQQLWDAVVAEYEEIVHPDLAKKAKEICLTQLQFHLEPERIYDVVLGIGGIGPCLHLKKTAALAYPIQPLWALYLDEARIALAGTLK